MIEIRGYYENQEMCFNYEFLVEIQYFFCDNFCDKNNLTVGLRVFRKIAKTELLAE